MLDFDETLREYKMNGSKRVLLPRTPIVALGARGANSAPQKYAQVLENGDPFRTSGDFCGAPVRPGYTDRGRLDESWEGSLSRADYIVWSWWTPIAWRVGDAGWVVPAAGTFGQDVESQTTKMHIKKIRTALALFTEYRSTPDH